MPRLVDIEIVLMLIFFRVDVFWFSVKWSEG